jgi:hypothetical protein
MIAFLLTGGTGLVSASAQTVPGDNLYPVKRSWEGVQLFFAFDQKIKHELEEHFENERVEEIHELFSEKRMEQVNFEGIVEVQDASIWQIDGLRIEIEDDTDFRGEIVPGARVQIIGETDDGIIKAEQVYLVSAPVATFTPNATSTSWPTSTLRPTVRPTDEATVTPSVREKPQASETPEVSETLEASETPEVRETLSKGETSEPRETPEKRKTPKPDDGEEEEED